MNTDTINTASWSTADSGAVTYVFTGIYEVMPEQVITNPESNTATIPFKRDQVQWRVSAGNDGRRAN